MPTVRTPPDAAGASVAAAGASVASTAAGAWVVAAFPPHAVNNSPINRMTDNPLNKLFFIFFSLVGSGNHFW
jgi:hypothetical protein